MGLYPRIEVMPVELICPACRRLIEISDSQALTGNRCRCKKCWETFYVECARPLKIRVETLEERIKRPAARTGVLLQGEGYGDDQLPSLW